MAFKDSTFDVIVSFETIEHLPDDYRFLREVIRVLKPEGYFFISTPHNKKGLAPQNPFHYREYSWDGFYELLSQYFKEIRLFGRLFSDRLSKLEKDMDKVRQFDSLGIRRLIPRKLRHLIASLLSRSKGGIGLDEVNVSDVIYLEELKSTSTLLAICRGPIYKS